MADPIVIQLQADCLDPSVPISTLLRKAKLVASKLDLADTEEWLNSELNGYTCSFSELPSYRIGMGQPKFFNPFHGWLDIVIAESAISEAVSSCYLPQAIAEIEHLANGDGSFVVFGFIPPINDLLHNTMNIGFNCGLHVSKTVLVGAVEGVKNAILDWAMQLEAKGIVGEGLNFSTKEIEKAHAVTNIYSSNIGVLGAVGNNAKVSHQTLQAGGFTCEQVLDLVAKVQEAMGGLPALAQKELAGPLQQMEEGAKANNMGLVRDSMQAMVPILQNASGSLVASSILAAFGLS